MLATSLQDPVCIFEHRVVLPGGEIRWQQWTHRALFDQAGMLLEYQSVGRDITELKRVEKALREADQRKDEFLAMLAHELRIPLAPLYTKKTIAYCVKTRSGRVLEEGEIKATRGDLEQWSATVRRPWVGALEATLFTGWIYDFLKPKAQALKVAHPAMLKAIAASKKKVL